MLKNYIKEAVILNKVDFNNIKGIELHYNKIKISLSILYYCLFLMGILWLAYTLKGNNYYYFIIPISMLITYLLQEHIARLIYRKPVLVLYKDKIYFYKSKQWYKLSEHDFEEVEVGNLDFSKSYQMIDKQKNIIFTIDNWYLTNPEDFKSKVRYCWLVSKQEERKEKWNLISN